MQHPPIATQIWDQKYRFKEADGTPIDETVEDSWSRIAGHLSSAEQTKRLQSHHALEFRKAFEDYKLLMAGRITAGAGTERDVTLFNCFVMGTIPDSMDGIFSMLREAALTMQQGGGIGYDFSTIRPKDASVKGVAADASGPLSFMDVWDAMCRTVMSAGERRGAMMATMRCDHPDVLSFIEAKKDASRLRMFNLSVLVTDDLMEAVKNGQSILLKHTAPPGPSIAKEFGHLDHELYGVKQYVYGHILASELWEAIIKTTYEVAEPGVIFIDRINKQNNLGYCETIAATNPCGEQPLPPYGACLLGSVNLARLVVNPFSDEAELDLDVLDQLVSTAVRAMDNVVDVSNFPIPEQQVEAEAKRRIGLGVTGVADALAMCQIKYGSEQAAMQIAEWQEAIALAAYQASIELAKEKGAFPLFDVEGFLREGSFAQTRLPIEMQDEIRKHGIRNALLTSIAPTGTISLYAGNVSSGIEPIFAYQYNRKVLNKDGSKRTEEVVDYAVALYHEMFPKQSLPDYFTNAQELTPKQHLMMQAAAQYWVDSSISKTINCPEDIDYEDFKEVYELAFEMGCKGCTTYRPNDVTGSILEVTKEPGRTTEVQEVPVGRPRVLSGETYKIQWPNTPHAMYLTFTDLVDLDTGQSRPYEVFINTKDVEHFAWSTALTRMISAVFRRGGDVGFVAQELKEVFDPKGGAFVGGKFVPSILAAIGDVVAEHMLSTGYTTAKEKLVGDQEIQVEANAHEWEPEAAAARYSGKACQSCGSYDLRDVGGCPVCNDCGHSKCG